MRGPDLDELWWLFRLDVERHTLVDAGPTLQSKQSALQRLLHTEELSKYIRILLGRVPPEPLPSPLRERYPCTFYNWPTPPPDGPSQLPLALFNRLNAIAHCVLPYTRSRDLTTDEDEQQQPAISPWSQLPEKILFGDILPFLRFSAPLKRIPTITKT